MMKKLLYIFGFLLCVSCNESAKKSLDTAPKSEESTDDADGLMDDNEGKNVELKSEEDTSVNSDYRPDNIKNKDLDFKTSNFTLETINTEISAKLQANYEAQLLAIKHPKFAEAIKEQLVNSTKFTEVISDSIQTITIEDIALLGDLQTRNDDTSIQKMRYTKRINSTYTQKDSVLVVIKRTVIEIDDTYKVNTSFVFEHLD